MAQIKEEQYNQIVEYINQYVAGGVMGISYEGYLAATGKKAKVKKVYSEYENTSFEEWWNTYPTTMKFSYKGEQFTGTRVLREQKEKCKALYVKVIDKYTPETILKALKAELQERYQESYRKRKLGHADANQFMYMKASVAYLNAERYIPYIGVTVAEVEETKKMSHTADVNI